MHATRGLAGPFLGDFGPFEGVLGPLRPAIARSGPFKALKRPPTGASGTFGPFACGMALHGANVYPATGSLRAAVPKIQNSDPPVTHLLCLLALLKRWGSPP